MEPNIQSPKVIIGLGNPGTNYIYTRHNIGFRIVDALVEGQATVWHDRNTFSVAEITLHNKPVTVIKPQTYMNNSGVVFSYLKKQGIKAHDIVVIHDELELPFGKLAIRSGGSARGHNGLKSLIAACGPEFTRLRVGIGRPENKEDVAEYVLEKFDQPKEIINALIDQALKNIETLYA
jgi:peptidyl-tRNA hydrolase, PTH1 family